MKALVLDRYGDPDVLHLADRPEPLLNGAADGLVTVRIHVSGVNPIDLGVRAGVVLPDEAHRFPMVLGWDGAGTVEAIGAEVSGLAVGDRVMVLSKQPSSGIGTHQDVVMLPKAQVVKLADGVSFERAAAAPLAALFVMGLPP